MNPQHQLDFISSNDKHGFLKGVSNWCNHRPLLLLGLFLTEGKVREMGAGDGSTSYLRNYCLDNNREFVTYDSNKEWAEKCRSVYVQDWDSHYGIYSYCGLCLIDHAPGEHRQFAIRKMQADIIVIHDSEIGGGGDYKLENIWPLFQYSLHFNQKAGGAGASAVSNKIDLNKYRGLKLGEFKFD